MKATRTIVPISTRNYKDTLDSIKAIKQNKDQFNILELRADSWKFMDYPSLNDFFGKLPKKLKYRFTCRHYSEAGPNSNGFRLYDSEGVNESMRINYIRQALKFTDIDIELATNRQNLELVLEGAKDNKREVTLSKHFWDTCPSGNELRNIVDEAYELSTGNVNVKLAIPVYSTRNALIGLKLIEDVVKSGRELTVAFISQPGTENIAKSARIASCLIGSRDQFFYFGKSNAPGQVNYNERKELIVKAQELQKAGDLDFTVKGFNRFAKSLFEN